LRQVPDSPLSAFPGGVSFVKFSDLDAFLCFWFFNDDWWQTPLETFYMLPLNEQHSKIVSWFHDATPALVPDLKIGVRPDDFRRVLYSMARHASFIVCGSMATARDLEGLVASVATRTRVIPYGHDHQRFVEAEKAEGWSETLSRYSILPSPPYFCCLGLYPRHKNVANVLRAARLLQERSPNLAFQLVLAGDPWGTSELSPLLDEVRSTLRVTLAGRVDHDDLPPLLGHSCALVYVSTLEGFGLPPLEAMSAGTLTVCSDLPVLRESCGSHPVYCNPAEASSIASAMGTCLRMPAEERANRIGLAREHAGSWTWECATEKLVRFLVNEVLVGS
jgi:glycosyltransferase involved in cell wall biosynthesis